jgi:hypothetical protein
VGKRHVRGRLVANCHLPDCLWKTYLEINISFKMAKSLTLFFIHSWK